MYRKITIVLFFFNLSLFQRDKLLIEKDLMNLLNIKLLMKLLLLYTIKLINLVCKNLLYRHTSHRIWSLNILNNFQCSRKIKRLY